MPGMRRRLIIFAGVAAMLAAGVAANQILPDRNPFPPIGQCMADSPSPARYEALDLSPIAVGLAASGGGSRAAYLTAAVLREIRRTGLQVPRPTDSPSVASLLEQIDLISSVSGGSLAATYFAQHFELLSKADADGPEWRYFLDRMARSYRNDLTRSALLRPASWVKWLFSDYNRGSLARERYAELLYGQATLADLPKRPALFINSFDVANHVRFVFSRHVVDTTYPLPRDYWGRLHEPRELSTANDVTFAKLDAASIKLADAVYASSAFPIYYPNMPLKYCGTRILFTGGQTFLADGAMADNTGLLTLVGEMRAALKDRKPRAATLVIAIDASLDRLGSSGSSFEDRGIEARYAWKNTIVGHANESINAAIALLQDVGWKSLEANGIVTDQLRGNWSLDLPKRTGRCGSTAKTSWSEPFESGQLLLRPLILRLGLRDVLNPNFLMHIADAQVPRPDALKAHLTANDLPDGLAAMSRALSKRIATIETDFTLTPDGRTTLDLAAYLLVHGKLLSDLVEWNAVFDQAVKARPDAITCTK